MRKGIAILALLVFLFSGTELHQLLKIPVLVQHLREHRRENPSITFFQFLKLHYEKIVVDDDYQRDQQLPFRDMDCAITFNLVTETPPSIIVFEEEPPVEQKVFHSKGIKAYSHQYLQDIFQPPRFSTI